MAEKLYFEVRKKKFFLQKIEKLLPAPNKARYFILHLVEQYKLHDWCKNLTCLTYADRFVLFIVKQMPKIFIQFLTINRLKK